MQRLVATAVFVIATLAAQAAGTVKVLTRDSKDLPVPDAVASLVPLDSARPVLQPPSDPVEIVQEDEEFHPYVTVVVTGTRIAFPNRDSVQHHVYSLSPAKRFEIPLYIGAAKTTFLFDKPGIVTLGCNIHDWMIAYVVVLETPYFAKTGVNGETVITGLPPGRYHLEIWHPRLSGSVEREVTIDSGTDTTQVISVTLKPDRRIRRAPDSDTGSYR